MMNSNHAKPSNTFSAVKYETATNTYSAVELDWNGGAGPGRAAVWFCGKYTIHTGGTPGTEYSAGCSLENFKKLVGQI